LEPDPVLNQGVPNFDRDLDRYQDPRALEQGEQREQLLPQLLARESRP